jgi:hypothetical protein
MGKNISKLLLSLVLLTYAVVYASMRKGPYLIYPGNNTEMQVLWQLTGSGPSTIEWGLDEYTGIISTRIRYKI